jgi:hypothetical protein
MDEIGVLDPDVGASFSSGTRFGDEGVMEFTSGTLSTRSNRDSCRAPIAESASRTHECATALELENSSA